VGNLEIVGPDNGITGEFDDSGTPRKSPRDRAKLRGKSALLEGAQPRGMFRRNLDTLASRGIDDPYITSLGGVSLSRSPCLRGETADFSGNAPPSSGPLLAARVILFAPPREISLGISVRVRPASPRFLHVIAFRVIERAASGRRRSDTRSSRGPQVNKGRTFPVPCHDFGGSRLSEAGGLLTDCGV